MILYSDVLSGPTSGGENNHGAYLSVFGKNFGSGGLGTTTKVYIGGSEVASYRQSRSSKVASIEQISVQVGALGNATPGKALSVEVRVGGVASNKDVTFTPNPGRLLYVDNVSGNDATAIPGDIAHPYRHVQTPALYTGGAWADVRPGDSIVLRGHGSANPWTDVGFEGYFMRFRNKSGSAPNGTAGTGPIVVTGYPGEDAYIRGTVANGMTGGCISAINGQSFPGMGQWAVVANLRIDCEGYDGPISQEIDGHHWRIVNNDLSASTAPRTGNNVPRMAGITGNGIASFWYGNDIHDIQGSSGECHGIYIDGDGSYDIGFNSIHDIRDGNGFQIYVNGSNGSNYGNNVSFHHNVIHDVSKHGINLADGTSNNIKVWNNLVYNLRYAGIRFNTVNLHGALIFHNTFYNIDTSGHPSYGALTNDWNLPNDAVDIENNIFYVAANTPYNAGSNGVPANSGIISRNLWANGSENTGFDSSPLSGSPRWRAAGSDFHLSAGSAAISTGAVNTRIEGLVKNDLDANARAPGPRDIGAYQH